MIGAIGEAKAPAKPDPPQRRQPPTSNLARLCKKRRRPMNVKILLLQVFAEKTGVSRIV